MKFDLVIRTVTFIVGLTVVLFAFWMLEQGKLGRFATVALAGTGVVLLLGVVVSNRLKPPDMLRLKFELQQTRKELSDRHKEVSRVSASVSEVLLVTARWGFRADGEPEEMKRWKQKRLLEVVYAAPSTQEKDHLLRLVRLIDAYDAAQGIPRLRAYDELLHALTEDGKTSGEMSIDRALDPAETA